MIPVLPPKDKGEADEGPPPPSPDRPGTTLLESELEFEFESDAEPLAFGTQGNKPPTTTNIEECPFCGDPLPARLEAASQRINHLRHCSDVLVGRLKEDQADATGEELIQQLKENLEARGKPPLPDRKHTWCTGCLDIFQDPVRTQHKTKCPGIGRKLMTKKAKIANTQPHARQRVEPPQQNRPSQLIEPREAVELDDNTKNGPGFNNLAQEQSHMWEGLPNMVDAAMHQTMILDVASHPVSHKLATALREALTASMSIIIKYQQDTQPCVLYMMMCKCLLYLPPGKVDFTQFDEVVAERSRQWCTGNYLWLWNGMLEADQRRKTQEAPAGDEYDVLGHADRKEDSQIRQAIKLVKLDRMGDAARALNEPGPAQLSAEIKEKLRRKFPDHVLEDLASADALGATQVDAAQVQSLINSFAKGLGPGLSQLNPDILRKCLKTLQGAEGERDHFLQTLQTFCNLMLKGALHPDFGPVMAGAHLTPIGPAARPIGAPDVLYRLAQKANARAAPSQLQPTFQGRQSVLEPNAGKRTVAQVMDMLATMPDVHDIGVMSLDIQNGFTAPTRIALANAVRTLYPQAYPIYRWAYSKPTLMRMRDGDIIWATSGTGQGDPISPAAFAMLFHQVLAQVHGLAEEEAWDILERAYMDDTTFVTRIPYLITIYSLFNTPGVKELGLSLNVPKSTIYIPNAGIESEASLRRMYGIPGDMVIMRTGTIIMGVPIGTQEFVKAHLQQVAADQQIWNLNLKRIGNQQMALHLYRTTSGVVRIQHLLAALPPDVTNELATTVDEQTVEMVQYCMDSHLRAVPATTNPSDTTRIFLPQSKGGLGMAPAGKVAHSAYISAEMAIRAAPELLQCKKLQSNVEMLKQTIHHFNRFVDAKDALIADECIREARAGKIIAQNDLTARIHNRTYDIILGDNSIPDLTRERLREQSRAGAMSWLKPRFWEQRILIRSEAFPLLLQRAIGLPMAPPESDCPRCSKREDMYLTHISECCPHGASITNRHNLVARRIGQLWKWTGRQVIYEKAGIIPGQRPADVWVAQVGNPAKDLAIDVTVIATATTLRLQRSQRVGFDATISSGRVLQGEEQSKLTKYADTFGPAGNSNSATRYIPAAWSTCGGRGTLAKLMVTDLASNLAQTWTYTKNECVDLIYGQVTSIIVNHVGMALYRAISREKGLVGRRDMR
jgi:hypothetical protein